MSKVNTAKKAAALKKNSSALEDALEKGTGLFGRVEKNLGDCMFKVTIVVKGKPTEVQGIVRGVMRGGAKASTFVQPSTFVLLTESSSKLHEIAAVINRPSDMKALKKGGLIPKALLTDGGEDDLFEEREDEDEDAEDEAKPKKAAAEIDINLNDL
jgi:hypothetical protein